MIALLIAIVIVSAIVLLYFVYDPFLDIVESGTHRHLVLWYKTSSNRTGRDHKHIIRLGRD